jgi:hypothetical protein
MVDYSDGKIGSLTWSMVLRQRCRRRVNKNRFNVPVFGRLRWTPAPSTRPVDAARLSYLESRSPMDSPPASAAGSVVSADFIHPAVPVSAVGSVSAVCPVGGTVPV